MRVLFRIDLCNADAVGSLLCLMPVCVFLVDKSTRTFPRAKGGFKMSRCNDSNSKNTSVGMVMHEKHTKSSVHSSWRFLTKLFTSDDITLHNSPLTRLFFCSQTQLCIFWLWTGIWLKVTYKIIIMITRTAPFNSSFKKKYLTKHKQQCIGGGLKEAKPLL